ncbi:MFS transporter, YNFM family, putative membrane transport protein [Lentibacillus halodurans]|uniref:MFS transporter, YNFM family, putative membrane transport protein n=1 Tax=Lentibacillus halodurans TaxID=237679 RepID=A0A1I0WG40_9BACI|nr:MFS transporter [Lentibacillus halodurans]SFA87524.1 MFS transporter, YNFM family, putative membrane transport protein [Lentibacillus halodurans]
MQQQEYTIKDLYFWRITLSLALASFFVFAGMYAVQPLLPVFVEDFGVPVSASGLVLSLTIVGLIIGLIVLGFMSDRAGRTIYIKLSLAGSAIPFLMIPLFDSFLLLLILRLVQGFALAGLPAAALAYLSEEIDRRSVHVATALYISSNALGGMIGRVMTGYITDHFSWEIAFYALAILGLVILVAVMFMLPASRFFAPSSLPFSRDLKAFIYHLKNPGLLLFFGLGIVLQLSFTGMWTYLPFYLQAPPFSLSLEVISYTFFAYGLGVIGSPLAGWLAGHFGLKTVRLTGVFVMSAGILCTLGSDLWMIVSGLCIACLGFFTAHSLTASSVSEEVTHHKGSASSLYLVSYYIGVSLGSSMLGPLWSGTGWTVLIVLLGIIPAVYVLIVRVMQSRLTK